MSRVRITPERRRERLRGRIDRATRAVLLAYRDAHAVDFAAVNRDLDLALAALARITLRIAETDRTAAERKSLSA